MTIEKLREKLRTCPKSEAEEVGRQLHELWLTDRLERASLPENKERS